MTRQSETGLGFLDLPFCRTFIGLRACAKWLPNVGIPLARFPANIVKYLAWSAGSWMNCFSVFSPSSMYSNSVFPSSWKESVRTPTSTSPVTSEPRRNLKLYSQMLDNWENLVPISFDGLLIHPLTTSWPPPFYKDILIWGNKIYFYSHSG